MSSTRKLRIAVIGTGDFAEAGHLPGLLAHPQAEVVAVCGRSAERARALAARFGVRSACTDVDELCARDDVDAVTICTANSLHKEQAIAASRSGKHVLCDKPLGLTVAEAEEMVRAAHASGRVHAVAFTFRYLHGVEALRRRVRAGDIGEPLLWRAHHERWGDLHSSARIGWRELTAIAGGGVLYEVGSHLFDLARFILGPIAEVAGTVVHLPRRGVRRDDGSVCAVETDDMASAWFRFASGTLGRWDASRVTPARAENRVQVIGREGALEALLSRGRVDALRVARLGIDEWEELPLPAEAHDGRAHAVDRMMRSFVDACLAGRLGELDASFEDGLATQRDIAALEASLRGGVSGRCP